MEAASSSHPPSRDGEGDAAAAGASPVENALGHRFAEPRLLEQALTHGSVSGLRRVPGRRPRRLKADRRLGYERLEFLGDRVLGLVVAEMLWRSFPEEAEGDLAKRFVQLVRQETLAAVCTRLDLVRHIRMTGDAATEAVIADVTEALIAALYLDGGLEAAAAFVRREWQPLLAAESAPPLDPKTALQEWVQGRGLPRPCYALVRISGPAHKPAFTVSVSVGQLPPESAEGPSKRQAESVAAATLLKRIRS